MAAVHDIEYIYLTNDAPDYISPYAHKQLCAFAYSVLVHTLKTTKAQQFLLQHKMTHDPYAIFQSLVTSYKGGWDSTLHPNA